MSSGGGRIGAGSFGIRSSLAPSEVASTGSLSNMDGADGDNYEDCRIELRSHNLTSVLVNPRESILENFLDEFSADQSVILDMSASKASHELNDNGNSNGSAASSSTSLSISSATENELRTLATSLMTVYRESGFANLVRIARAAEANSKSKVASGLVDDVVICYRDVPPMFFRPDFSLSNPEMFNQVLGPGTRQSHQKGSGGVRDGPSKQEVLSRYLDLVEVALLKQIWQKSTAFFRALDDIKGLQVLVAAASGKLVTLRSSLRKADDGIAMSAMRIPQLQRRRKNENSLCSLLLHIKQVLHGKKDAEELLAMEDYVGAMDVVTGTRRIYSEHLTQIVALRHIGAHLDESADLICDIMCNKFVSLCVSWDVDDSIDLGKFSAGTQSLDMAVTTPVLPSPGTSVFHDNLSQLVFALMAVDKLHAALMLYKSRLSEAIRLIVRTCVLEFLSVFDPTAAVELIEDSSSGPDADTPFAMRVRSMSNENFLLCLSSCFENLLQALHRCDSVYQFVAASLENKYSSKQQLDDVRDDTDIGDTTSSAMRRSSGIKSAEDLDVTLSLNKSCKTSCCELAQRSLSQLISLRKEATAKLPVDKMKSLWESSLTFVSSLEAISGSTAYEVRQCLMVQTKAFLDHLHETFKNRLINTLDNERWVQCDVAPERQAGLDRLASGKAFLQTNSNSAFSQSSSSSSSILQPDIDSASATIGSSGDTKKKDFRSALVEGHQFKVVWSVMLLIEIALNYLEVSCNFPLVTTDIISKIVELFKLFDVRTKQLVLGAQAIQSAARLKNISAKHLCITAQSVGLLLALLPHVRAALLAQLPPKHHMLLTELDRISHNLIDHHNQLLSKFVGIVGDFVDASAQRLKGIDWDRYQGQCEYFLEVERNVSSLHRVLQTALPQEQVQDVFTRIFALLNRKIVSHFEDIIPSTQTGKQRILDEVNHIVTQFRMLKQVNCSGITLEESFKRRFTAK